MGSNPGYLLKSFLVYLKIADTVPLSTGFFMPNKQKSLKILHERKLFINYLQFKKSIWL